MVNFLSGNMAEVEVFILKITIPSQYLSSQFDVEIRQIHMICFEDEWSVIQQVLEEPHFLAVRRGLC